MDDLQGLLTSRIVGKGYSRVQPQGHPTIDASTWRPIEQTLALLPDAAADTMPNIRVQRQQVSPAQWTQLKEGYTDTHAARPEIVLMSSGRNTYDKAAKGNLVPLAGLLMHERQHVVGGPDETAAYDAQLAELERLGAPRSLLENTRAARHSVTQGPK